MLFAAVASVLIHLALIGVLRVDMAKEERQQPLVLEARLPLQPVPLAPAPPDLQPQAATPPDAKPQAARPVAKAKRHGRQRPPSTTARAPASVPDAPGPATESIAPPESVMPGPTIIAAAPAVASADSPAAPPVDSPATAPVDPLPANPPAVKAAAAPALPPRLTLRFKVHWGIDGPAVGRAEYRWRQDGDRYNLQSVTEPAGVVALFKPGRLMQTSLGAVTGAGLRPETFIIRIDKRRGNSALFDWSERTLKLIDSEKIVTVALPDGAQDIMSFLFQFAFSPPADAAQSLALVDGRKLDHYRIAMLGYETLQLDLGSVKTVHVRKPKTADDDGMDVWLAVDHYFLPVKVRNDPRKDQRPIELLASEIGLPDDPREADAHR